MIKVIKGDITEIPVDIIVNAANPTLLGGEGVDGAIHKVGGEQILKECTKIRKKRGECPVGDAVITKAGNLPAKYVIHTVGPIWKNGTEREDELLYKAYLNSLELAMKHKAKSISFPNISTGIYGFPKERAAQIALSTVLDFAKMYPKLKDIIFVCFDDENYTIYDNLIHRGTNEPIIKGSS